MDELEVAVSAARQAGALALELRARGLRAERKARHDLVSEADRASQRRIADVIAAAFPDDLMVGEEGSPPPESEVVGTRRWYVDPVDGTTNFLKGRHWWGVSVAFCDADDRITAGAVHLPDLDRTYAAAEGRGATCDGEPIGCSDVDGLDGALCASGFPTGDYLRDASDANLAVWRRLMRSAQSLRATGAVAPDWCSIASGETDGAWTLRVGRWDIAAAALIAREAGARVTDLAGQELRGPATAGIAATPGVHAELLAEIRAALAPSAQEPGMGR